MRIEINKGLLEVALIIISVTTIILAAFSFFNIDNWYLRIFTQGSLCLMMLLRGMQTISLQKEKYTSGYLYFGVATFILFVMIYSIIVGIKINAF
jgi:hypothetical protein